MMVKESGVSLELTGVSTAKWGFSGPNLDIVSWAWFQNIRREIYLVAIESDGTASVQQVMGKQSIRETPFVSNQNGAVIATVVNGDVFIFETDDGKTFTESKVSPTEDLNSWGRILSLTIERTTDRHLVMGIFQEEGQGELEPKKESASCPMRAENGRLFKCLILNQYLQLKILTSLLSLVLTH